MVSHPEGHQPRGSLLKHHKTSEQWQKAKILSICEWKRVNDDRMLFLDEFILFEDDTHLTLIWANECLHKGHLELSGPLCLGLQLPWGAVGVSGAAREAVWLCPPTNWRQMGNVRLTVVVYYNSFSEEECVFLYPVRRGIQWSAAMRPNMPILASWSENSSLSSSCSSFISSSSWEATPFAV